MLSELSGFGNGQGGPGNAPRLGSGFLRNPLELDAGQRRSHAQQRRRISLSLGARLPVTQEIESLAQVALEKRDVGGVRRT